MLAKDARKTAKQVRMANVTDLLVAENKLGFLHKKIEEAASVGEFEIQYAFNLESHTLDYISQKLREDGYFVMSGPCKGKANSEKPANCYIAISW